MRTPACALLFLFASGAAALAQSTTAGACSIAGSVANSVTGAPIIRAHVSVVGANDSALADTDEGGNWHIEHLACGRVSIVATRPGFLRTQQSIAGLAPSVLLVADTPTHGVKLELTPQAVLAGRVLDNEGDPIQGAQISLMTTRIINGLRGIQASNSTTTNDLGEYRFPGLTAGKYFLCANAGGGAVVANGATPYGERCYPGPVDAGAAGAMELAAGYEGRVDFTLSPLATVHVSGVVLGQPAGVGSSLSLTPRTQIARMFMGLSAQVRPDGTFSIRGVPPGSYTITARAAQLVNNRLMAHAPLDVGVNDVEGIQLHLEGGVTVTGTIKVQSTTGKKIERPQYTVLLRGQDGAMGPGISGWDDNRTSFSIADIMPGDYRLEFSAPAPFYLKSATMGGHDIVGSDVAIAEGANNIEIVVRDDGGIVEGDVSANDMPAAAWIFLERDGSPSRNGRADVNGHFKMDNIPPGDYKIYAWDDPSRVEYANPAWMLQNGKGVAVTVEPGQSAQVKLDRLIAPPE